MESLIEEQPIPDTKCIPRDIDVNEPSFKNEINEADSSLLKTEEADSSLLATEEADSSLLTTEEVSRESNNSTCKNGVKSEGLDAPGLGAVVAAHYNMIEEKGLTERNQSRIVYLRNFNNWIKSMLINEFLEKVRDSKPANAPLKVLDMCCGKGGDLSKWRIGRIKHLVCVDLAETSVKQCQNRFKDIEERMKQDRNLQHCFTAEFIPADCTKVRLRARYKDPSISLDLVSCQFSFHYSFESLAQAECMLQNAAECLQPGGYFIGTMPDANEIMARQEAAGSLSFGNDIYTISFENDKKPYALFGGKYDFHLEGVVNCPEFLVHFPTLERLAKKYGLQMVKKESFEDFFQRMRREGRMLLTKMQALETYPPQSSNDKLFGKEDVDYEGAKEHVNSKKSKLVGTLSTPEWEAATLYLVFAFEKMDRSWDSEGKPVYTPHVSKSRKKRLASDEDSAAPCKSTKSSET